MMMSMMKEFLITTTMLKMEVSQGRAKVRENIPRKMGDRTEVYQKVENMATTMAVMMTMISTKET